MDRRWVVVAGWVGLNAACGRGPQPAVGPDLLPGEQPPAVSSDGPGPLSVAPASPRRAGRGDGVLAPVDGRPPECAAPRPRPGPCRILTLDGHERQLSREDRR